MVTGSNPFSLSGKVVLVTGASSGIGRATAVACANMGAKVICVGRNEGRLQETMALLPGDGHVSMVAELTNGDDLARLVESCPELNGVSLCAGKGLTLPFAFCTREKYDDLFEVNYFATVELLRLLAKRKKLLRGASVVLVASIGGISGFSPGNAIYGATKAALASTMKFCAKEFAPKLIRVNSVNPGMINTPFIRRGTLSEDQFAADAQTYPLKRYGEPEDIANGIVYLLSDASSWVTGHELVIDGGKTI